MKSDVRMRILVIEDDKNIAKIVAYNLEKENYQVAVARDGEEGLEKARKELPQLIILDLMLPKLDGLEVCRTVRIETGTPVRGVCWVRRPRCRGAGVPPWDLRVRPPLAVLRLSASAPHASAAARVS